MLDLKAAACIAAQSIAILQCVPHGWLMPALETGFLYQGQNQKVAVQGGSGGSPEGGCRKCLLHKLHCVAAGRAEVPCPGWSP